MARSGPIGLWLREQLNTEWESNSRKKQDAVKVLFLRILLQDLNNQQLKRELSELFPKAPEQAKQLSELRPLWANSEFSNRYKLALLRFRKNMYVFRSFGFDPIATTREFFELQTPELQRAVRRARKQVIQPLSLRLQDDMIVRVTNDLRPRLYAFSRKRQTFIVTSHHLSHDDMVGDLLCRVIENARWYYPFRTYQHMINSCYQAASNHGINRIKWFNARKRQRLVSDGSTGFFNREVAEEAEFLSGTAHPQANLLEETDNSIFYQQLLKSFSEPVEQQILVLLLGIDGEQLLDEFFTWSSERLDQPIESTEQLIDLKLHEEHISDFLQVSSFKIHLVRELLHRKMHHFVDL